MKWRDDASTAISRMPFSMRRKAKTRAEAAALRAGRDFVEIAVVEYKELIFGIIDAIEKQGL